MKPLSLLLQRQRTLRVIGFDDAPFEPHADTPVAVAGVVCAGTRFEGMLWSTIHKDGNDATAVLGRMLCESKFHPQVHLVLIDGLGLGGFNLVDLPALATVVERPCVAVMRNAPDLAAVRSALQHLPDTAARLALLEKAGPVYHAPPFHFQVQGAAPEAIGPALAHLTLTGHVPEALRMAHLIGAAVMRGESGRRA